MLSVATGGRGSRWAWWGLLWTQQLIKSDVSTVTLHNNWYNYIKKNAKDTWLYSCFSTCTWYWERKTPFWKGWRAGLISSSSKNGQEKKEEGAAVAVRGQRSKVLHGTARWGGWKGKGEWVRMAVWWAVVACKQPLKRWARWCWTDWQIGGWRGGCYCCWQGRREGCQRVKTVRWQLRHESVKCTTK